MLLTSLSITCKFYFKFFLPKALILIFPKKIKDSFVKFPERKMRSKSMSGRGHRSLFVFVFELVLELKTSFGYSQMLIPLYSMQLYPKCEHPTVSKILFSI